jgi:hypothetical protein
LDTPTALAVLNDAAVELGLVFEDIANPFTSTDKNIILLRRLLKRVGRELVRARDWTQLTREYTFNTAASTASYVLPTGYARMKDQTQWNRTTTSPLTPPVGGQDWQTLKARTATGLVTVPFRVWGNLLHIYPTPTAIQAIYYEYITKYWVLPTGQTVPTLDAPTATTDVLWFDESLISAALRLAWKRNKELPTGHAEDEFRMAWSEVAGSDGAAPPLSVVGSAERFLFNVHPPDTGWGL